MFQSGALEVQSDEELEMIELAGKLSEFEVERQVKRDEQQAGDTQCVVVCIHDIDPARLLIVLV